ncbi:hypothetical protein Pcinc_010864 [Petrolisthes cinctipes]|uniref:Uncharacterized protein n=1 Tax=Petrolisthes cinctipes TaxID=88211 RepID=A0AAE1KWZ6_PETCI|nr:hypothetical protein Pcinc_010864 [Petrolisthes cinctipes]
MSCSTKWPPKLMNEAAYNNWKKDVEIWGKLTDIPKNKQALAIHLSLDGRARVASSELEVAVLESDGGVEALLKKLDGLFLVDKGRRQFIAFQEIYNLRRGDGLEVRKFISKFEHAYFQFTIQGMSLPDVTYDNMTSVLSRSFSGGFGAQASGFSR